MQEIKVEYVSIDKIKPYQRNARKHDSKSIEVIANSISEFGMADPIAVWGKENIVIEGHGRLLALKQLGYDKAPIIHLDYLTDEQRRAYTLAHNKTAEFSEWDMELLTDEAESIFNIDLSDFGFDLSEDEEEETEVIEDEVPQEVEPVAKQGDIWQLGRHRLMCGDSTSIDNMDKLFDGNTIDLVLSDPPYGIDVVQNNSIGGDKAFGKVDGGHIVKSNTYMKIKGDETTDTAREFYNSCVSMNIYNYILFGGNYFTDFLEPKACWIVWDKQNTGNFADVELAWTSFDKGAKLYQWLWNGLCRKGDRKAEGSKRVHPTQKPVGLLADILNDFSKENDNIFDGFGGSGSTLIACEQTNRNCYMIELDPHYVDVIIARWEKFTGQKAVLLNG